MSEEILPKQFIKLPNSREGHWKELLPIILSGHHSETIELDCKDWILTCNEIKQILERFSNLNLNLESIKTNIPETIISASSLGIPTSPKLQVTSQNSARPESPNTSPNLSGVQFHQGTLRSGEHLEAQGDILILGDINPGAKISANGDVMIWGRLRGIAHAGKSGNLQAKIISLQLRPLQIRIGNLVARGPNEKPQEGFAEQALVEAGQIVIKPAQPNFSKLV